MLVVIRGSLLASLFLCCLLPLSAQGSPARRAAFLPEWAALLHISPQGVAAIADPGFLLSWPAVDVQKEYDATLQLFAEQPEAVCRFPARYWFLRTHSDATLPDVVCPEYDEFAARAPLDSISLIYSSENLTQPSSMMGHTMLAIAGVNSSGRRVEHSVSFFTELDTLNLPLILWDTLVIGKEGYFSVQPLNLALDNYLHREQRNVWRYNIRLSEDQKTLIHRHLWELKQTNIDYFFNKHNCATLTQDILAIAYPELVTDGEWLSPLDVVRNIDALHATDGTTVYASNRWKVRLLSEFTGEKDPDELWRLPEAPSSSMDYLRIAQAGAYNDYLLESGSIGQDEWQARRASLPEDTLSIDLNGYRSPLKAPADSQWTFGYRHAQDADWLTLSWMPASHTLEDDNRNYFSENQLILTELEGAVNTATGDLRLRRWRMYDVRSLIPHDQLTGGLSGYLHFGFDQYADEQLHGHTGFLASAGLGRTYALSRDLFVYGLGGIGATLGSERQFMTLEPEVGAYLYELWNMKSWLSYREVFSKPLPRLQRLSFTQSLWVSNHYSLLGEWSRQWNHSGREIAWEIKGRYYF